jgi:hypothetical protein
VVRRVPVRADVPGHEPAAEVRNEAVALGLVGGFDWAPALIAADPQGARCGVAASIQTLVPGRVDLFAVEAMASAIRTVATAEVDPAGLPAFDPWIDWTELLPPRWTADPGLWERALARLDGWLPEGEGLVHRDLHPGNVLVNADRKGLGGLVDWVHAARGPVEVDVLRCRVNVGVIAGLDAADELLARCRDLVPDYDRRWDILVAAELAPEAEGLVRFTTFGARLTVPVVLGRLDRMVQGGCD